MLAFQQEKRPGGRETPWKTTQKVRSGVDSSTDLHKISESVANNSDNAWTKVIVGNTSSTSSLILALDLEI